MKRKLTIPSKAFSINAMTYRDKRTKTAAFYEWSHTVLHLLNSEENQKAFSDLRDHFDPTVHAVEATMTAYYPKEVLFTKKGMISAKSFDITNIEKPLVDLIFLPVYFDKPSPYGVKNFNNDDKYLVSFTSKKRFSDKYMIEFEISIIDLQELFDHKSHDTSTSKPSKKSQDKAASDSEQHNES